MTSSIEPTRTVSIYTCTRGFAYAVMENPITLIEANLVTQKNYDEKILIKNMKKVLSSFGEITLVLEDFDCMYHRKGKRSIEISRKIYLWAKRKGIVVKKYSRKDIRDIFSRWMAHTKYDIVQILTQNIEGLQPFYYEPVKYPHSPPSTEAVFSAVSLLITYYFKEG